MRASALYLLFGLPFAGGISYFLITGISRLLKVATDFSTSIAAGDLSVHVENAGKDEIAALLAYIFKGF